MQIGSCKKSLAVNSKASNFTGLLALMLQLNARELQQMNKSYSAALTFIAFFSTSIDANALSATFDGNGI